MTDVERDVERALVARLKAGHGEAFDQIYAAYNGRLFNFIARLTRRREIAEDLTEELEGFTPAEAAAVCGVSPEAMRQRLSRGRALLARRLEREQEPGRVRVLKEALP